MIINGGKVRIWKVVWTISWYYTHIQLTKQENCENQVRMASNQAEIWIGYLPNANVEHFYFSNLFSESLQYLSIFKFYNFHPLVLVINAGFTELFKNHRGKMTETWTRSTQASRSGGSQIEPQPDDILSSLSPPGQHMDIPQTAHAHFLSDLSKFITTLSFHTTVYNLWN
jgi:hypothetical protein